MKKITLLFFFFITAASFSQIPNWSWAKSMPKYFSHENGDFTTVDNAGNVYVIGDFTQASISLYGATLTNAAPSFADMYILKFTRDGDLIWARSFGGVKHDYISSITTDSAGNFYLAGGYQGSVAFGSFQLNSSPDLGGSFIAKFDSDGNAIWAKKTNAGEYCQVSNIRTDATGNVYLAGSFTTPTVSFGGSAVLTYQYYSATNNSPRAMVVKLDPNGNGIWARSAQSDQENVFGSLATSIAVDNAGGVAICGRFNSNTTNFGSINFTKTTTYYHSSNMFIVKYDSNGTELWGHRAGTIYENNNCANSIACDAGNNLVISGYFCNTIDLAGTTLTSGVGAQFFVARFNPSGVLQWARSPQYSTAYSGAWSVDVDAAGNAYCAAMTFSSAMIFGNGVSLSNQGNNSLFVVRYNAANGNAAWARSALGLNANNKLSIKVRSENEMYIAGTYDSPTLTFGGTTLTNTSTNYDFYLARLFYQPLSNTLFDAAAVSFYPNPTNGIVHFGNLETAYDYKIFNTLGQCVKTGTFTATNETLDISGFQSGAYVIVLNDGQGDSLSRKIIKE